MNYGYIAVGVVIAFCLAIMALDFQAGVFVGIVLATGGAYTLGYDRLRARNEYIYEFDKALFLSSGAWLLPYVIIFGYICAWLMPTDEKLSRLELTLIFAAIVAMLIVIIYLPAGIKARGALLRNRGLGVDSLQKKLNIVNKLIRWLFILAGIGGMYWLHFLKN